MSPSKQAVVRYRIERPLGRGGMAAVYLARDDSLERPVALKVLAENLAGDPAFRDRFLREARLAARLVHPNVVRVYDIGEDERGPFIVMEYVEGETLAEELARRHRLPPDEVVAVAIQICSALEAAHAQRLVHRDIKPQNILRAQGGQVKLADFGIARSLAATQHTEIGTVLGTAAYLSPEQARGLEVTAAADIYSLGVVIYELLTGRPPITPASLPELLVKREQGAIAPPRELVPEIPAALEAVVMRCLALEPEYRPPSAAALAAELAAAIGEPDTIPLPAPTGILATQVPAPTAATTALSAGRGPRKGNRRGLFAGVATALALLALGLVLAVSSSEGGKTATPPIGHRANLTKKTVTPAATRTRTAANTQTPPTTTTRTSQTTTAAPPSPSTALAALVRDVSGALAAGAIDPGSGQQVSNQAQHAIADEAAAKPDQAANDLQQAAVQIGNAVQSGHTSAAEGAKLQSDLSTLASVLGLAAASEPPPPSPAPDRGHGHGHGHGQGDSGDQGD